MRPSQPGAAISMHALPQHWTDLRVSIHQVPVAVSSGTGPRCRRECGIVADGKLSLCVLTHRSALSMTNLPLHTLNRSFHPDYGIGAVSRSISTCASLYCAAPCSTQSAQA